MRVVFTPNSIRLNAEVLKRHSTYEYNVHSHHYHTQANFYFKCKHSCFENVVFLGH